MTSIISCTSELLFELSVDLLELRLKAVSADFMSASMYSITCQSSASWAGETPSLPRGFGSLKHFRHHTRGERERPQFWI
jgi:hypothetical protein